jgi:hypothetical protein
VNNCKPGVISVEIGELVSLAGNGGSAARARPRDCDTYIAPAEGTAPGPASENQAMAPAETVEEGQRYYIACFYTDTQPPELAYADYFIYQPGIEARLAEAIARSLADELPLPHPMPATSPGIDAPQLVGIPTWLWTETPWQPVSLSAQLAGLDITVTATPTSIHWDLGEDDTATITCPGPGTPWNPHASDDQTSDCTHTYTYVPDPPATAYPASATLTWDVTYTATGQPGGDLGTNATTTTFELTVTQRQAVVCYDTPAEDCNPA